jgi:hypothetical protein
MMHTALGEIVTAPLPYSQQLFTDGSLGPIVRFAQHFLSFLLAYFLIEFALDETVALEPKSH